MFILLGNKKAILILFTIIMLTTITCVSAQNNDTINQTDTHTITKDTTQSTVKTESTPDDTIYITQANKKNYKDYDYPENTNIIVNESLDNFEFYICNKNITITGKNDAVLSNSHIEVYDYGTVHISNLTFKTNDTSKSAQVIYLETDNNTLENLTFIENRNALKEKDFYCSINLYGDNNSIVNCSFDITQPSKTINWDTFSAECNCESIRIHGDHNLIKDNYMTITENTNKEYPFGTIFGISVRGSYNNIDNNTVLMEGTLYLYGIRIYYSSNNVTNNYIEVHSIRYANGIAIESPQSGSTSDNYVKNNTVIVTTSNDTIPGEPEDMQGKPVADAAYGIMITEYRYVGGGTYTGERSNTAGNIIEDNNIMGYSTHMYAIELFGGSNTTINKNKIYAEGYSALGIAGGAAGTKITNNEMVVIGQTNATLPSADYYRPQTSGVYLQYGTGTEISGNTITTDFGPAVKTNGEVGTLITNNTMEVTHNEVAVNVDKGTADIIGNAIKDFYNHIINGGKSEGNYDPGDIQGDDPQSGNNNGSSDNPTEENGNGTNTSDDNGTDTPSGNGTDTPSGNGTDTPDTNGTETPDTNGTDTPEGNGTEIPENNTETPEPQPPENNTETPKNQTTYNNTDTNKTNNNTRKNNTVTPDVPISNNTVIPINQSTQPSQGELINDTIVNNTNEYTNETSSAGDEPDKDNKKKDPEPIDEPKPSENKPEPQSNDEPSEDTIDSAGLDPAVNKKSESDSSDKNSKSKLEVTATVNPKVYEVTQKLPDDLVPEHPEVIVGMLIILCIAFTFGYVRKRK
ncbi:MAG: hypothetical protein BZ135_09040 [Methanosphaera sp. rholeuAM6]|nr:MAG: hypothetical protein BZ135_09040 [Methanosphaera sp. rholeuAM6]